MQDNDLSLIVRESAQGASEIQFGGIIPVRWFEPCRFWLKRRVPLQNFYLIQSSIAYAREHIRFLVRGPAQIPVFHQLEKYLLYYILSATVLA
jgi:hypothetical protein